MKTRNFEKLLAQQSIRKLPPQWKDDIVGSPCQTRSVLLILNQWLWPSPWAWAGMAAIWLFAIGLNGAASLGSDLPKPAAGTSIASFNALLEQRRMFMKMDDPSYSEYKNAADQGVLDSPQSALDIPRKKTLS